MSRSPIGSHLHLSRFDRLAWLVIAGSLALAGLLAWRGDRVGARVAAFVPELDAAGISTETTLRLTFAQPMNTTDTPALTLQPAAPGETTWDGSTLIFTPAAPLQPDTLYTVTLPPLRSQQGQRLLRVPTWQFRTRPPHILFLSPDAQGQQQLFVTALDGQPPRPLTQGTDEVVDFVVSPDAGIIAYSLSQPDGRANLWFIPALGGDSRQLVDCAGDVCSAPTWTPDGRRLIYERRARGLAGAPPGPPRLWWVDLASGETVPVFQDSQLLGMNPRISPDGRWLSFNVPFSQEVQAYNLETGQSVFAPSQTGEVAAWSPDSRRLLLTDVQIQGEAFAINLFSADVYSHTVINLSAELNVNDGFPAWSPDGAWIAFNRKLARAPMGKQLWLARADGSEAKPLTQDADVNHGPPRWSPDARSLLFQRYILTSQGEPGIWLLNVQTGAQREIARVGSQPAWLP